MDSLPEHTRSNSGIIATYRARTPGSAALAREAANLFPSGITHDSRQLDPYGIYIARAQGAHKWDVDGNRYVDYFGGHGALFLGHNHPVVTAADARTPSRRAPSSAPTIRGSRLGAGGAAPGALGRAGALHLLRHRGHADGAAPGARVHRQADDPALPGPLPRLARPHDQRLLKPLRRLSHARRASRRGGEAVLVPPNDLDAVRTALAGNRDIAAVILEPTGSSFGQVPIGPTSSARCGRRRRSTACC